MAIDIKTAGSDGWWLAKLSKKLRLRQDRLNALDARFRGDAPLPPGAENMQEVFRAFWSKARTNYAELIVESLRERLTPVGFRTALSEPGDRGDDTVLAFWQANGLDVEFADVVTSMLSMGDAYMIVGGDAETGPIITGEDPRQVVTIHDPVQQRIVRAGLKMFHDADQGRDLAYLYMPGYVRVAAIDRVRNKAAVPIFSASTWNWDEELSGDLPHDRVPVVRFRNKRGVGEFEPHVDLLDRLDHQVLQRMTIATLQAFRQRAIKVDPKDMPEKDDAGEAIDYDEMLRADPGSLWKLPLTAELWESGQVDLTPLLSADKDDVRKLAAVTRTPVATLMPGDDSGGGSAEGASFKREGLVFKAEDRLIRLKEYLKDLASLGLLVLGETERADRASIEPLFSPIERISMAERYDAAAKAKAAGVPWRTVMIDILGFTPQQTDEMAVLAAAEGSGNIERLTQIANAAQSLYLPVQSDPPVLSAEEAREILRLAGADLPGPPPVKAPIAA